MRLLFTKIYCLPFHEGSYPVLQNSIFSSLDSQAQDFALTDCKKVFAQQSIFYSHTKLFTGYIVPFDIPSRLKPRNHLLVSDPATYFK